MKRTITVTGVGRVTVVPDVADVRLGVSATRPTVAEARQAAAEVAARILEAVTAAGVARPDVRTATLQVQPEYEYTDRAPKLRGQNVSHQYVITVRALDTIGRVIDDGLAAGATTLDGVVFRTADPAEAEAAARAAAVRDARSKAEALAAEAGIRVGDVVSMTEVVGGGPTPILRKARVMMAAAEAAPTPVEAGTDEVVVSVLAAFEIPGAPASAASSA
jgi:uncharacterized protein YggE